MIIKGKVHKLGDDINTDDIIAAKYLVTTDEKELAKHFMENLFPDFAAKIHPGDIVVAGKNFGCGSSREHAPLAIKGAGVSAVIAKNFAGIFFRNAINIGLPFLESDAVERISEGDVLEIDLSAGLIKNLSKNEEYNTQPFPKFLQEIVEKKGLINLVKSKPRRSK